MRIALLAHARHPIAEPFRGGLEAHTAVTADVLVGRGHDVTLFAKAGSESRADVVEIVDADLTFGRAWIGGVDRAELVLDSAYAQALDLVERGGYDAVLDNTLSPVPYRRRTGLPTLTVLHTPATLERTNAVITARGWRPRRDHRFVAVSATTRKDWRRLLPKVGRVLNGIDLGRWYPADAPDADRHAVWAGRITPEKGLHVAIEAARLAGWPLRISGPVSNPAYFAEHVAPRLGPEVTYVGHLRQAELRAFLAAGSVLLFSPRWEEPFGLAAVESIACGTPVAALPAGAAHEVVDARAGVLAAEPTADALAVALVRASALDRGRVRSSAARFDAARMVAAYERVLAELVELPGLSGLSGLAGLTERSVGPAETVAQAV